MRWTYSAICPQQTRASEEATALWLAHERADAMERQQTTSPPKACFSSGIARCPWPIELRSGEKPRLVWLFDDY